MINTWKMSEIQIRNVSCAYTFFYFSVQNLQIKLAEFITFPSVRLSYYGTILSDKSGVIISAERVNNFPGNIHLLKPNYRF